MLLCFYCSTRSIGNSNIIPSIDVDFFNVISAEIFGKNGVFSHFRIKFIAQFGLCKSFNYITGVKKIFVYI